MCGGQFSPSTLWGQGWKLDQQAGWQATLPAEYLTGPTRHHPFSRLPSLAEGTKMPLHTHWDT